MACVNRRGCLDRFRGTVDGVQLMAILAAHGSCWACALDATDHPRFREADGMLRPYCPACFEARWPTGAPGPFEAGAPQVYR